MVTMVSKIATLCVFETARVNCLKILYDINFIQSAAYLLTDDILEKIATAAPRQDNHPGNEEVPVGQILWSGLIRGNHQVTVAMRQDVLNGKD